MASRQLSEGVKHTVEKVRELIENKTAVKEEKVGTVWKYSGQELSDALEKLKGQINDEGNKVSDAKPVFYAILTFFLRLSSAMHIMLTEVQTLKTPQATCS